MARTKKKIVRREWSKDDVRQLKAMAKATAPLFPLMVDLSHCLHPWLSGDGYRIAFDSLATNADVDVTEAKCGVFLCNLSNGTIARASIGASGVSANEGAGGPVLSTDGHWLAFSTSATNLVESDTNGADDVFVRGPLP